ncbi:MAG: PEP-CTERM sorting domain-containing protein [Armatimonadota bacterium]
MGIALVAVPAFAQTYGKVTSRTTLAGTDYIDWGQRARNSAVPDGTDFTSAVFGIEGEVSFADGPGRRLDAGLDRFGGFLPNEALLWTQGGGPLTIIFSDLGVNGVYGVGSQVWFNYPPVRETSIDLLGEGGSVLANFTYSTGGGFDFDNGQASFIGGTSSNGNIKGIRFNNAGNGIEKGDFAINKLSLKIRGVDGGNTEGGTNGGGNTGGGGQDAVPEPGEWAAMGILGLGLAGLVIRKRRA